MKTVVITVVVKTASVLLMPDARWSHLALMQHFVCSQIHCFNRLQHHPENLPFLHVVLYMSCLWYRYCYFFYRPRQFLVPCVPIKKKGTIFLPVTLPNIVHLPSDTISEWLNLIHMQKCVARTSFFLIALLDCGAYVRSLCGCFCVATAKMSFFQWTKCW